jgi:hypothetical protein
MGYPKGRSGSSPLWSNTGILTQPALQQEIIQLVEKIPGVASVVGDFESPPIEYMFP